MHTHRAVQHNENAVIVCRQAYPKLLAAPKFYQQLWPHVSLMSRIIAFCASEHWGSVAFTLRGMARVKQKVRTIWTGTPCVPRIMFNRTALYDSNRNAECVHNGPQFFTPSTRCNVWCTLKFKTDMLLAIQRYEILHKAYQTRAAGLQLFNSYVILE